MLRNCQLILNSQDLSQKSYSFIKISKEEEKIKKVPVYTDPTEICIKRGASGLRKMKITPSSDRLEIFYVLRIAIPHQSMYNRTFPNESFSQTNFYSHMEKHNVCNKCFLYPLIEKECKRKIKYFVYKNGGDAGSLPRRREEHRHPSAGSLPGCLVHSMLKNKIMILRN